MSQYNKNGLLVVTDRFNESVMVKCGSRTVAHFYRYGAWVVQRSNMSSLVFMAETSGYDVWRAWVEIVLREHGISVNGIPRPERREIEKRLEKRKTLIRQASWMISGSLSWWAFEYFLDEKYLVSSVFSILMIFWGLWAWWLSDTVFGRVSASKSHSHSNRDAEPFKRAYAPRERKM